MAFHPAVDALVLSIRPKNNNNQAQTTGKDYRLNRQNAQAQQAADNYRKQRDRI